MGRILTLFNDSTLQGEEPRTIQAVGTVMRRGLCNLILLGNKEKIETLAKQFRVDISQAQIIDPRNSPDIEKYAKGFYEARKHKVSCFGLTFHFQDNFKFSISD